jgi:putative addiction module component (TIGR02574 family)
MRLIEAVWDRLLDAGAQPELTAAQRAELDRRIAALEADPNEVVSWRDPSGWQERA